MCPCPEESKIKFASFTFTERALKWWNGHVKSLSLVTDNAMGWDTLKDLLTREYCPRGEIQKLEEELWNLRMKGTDVVAYMARFCDLVTMCPIMIPTEGKKIERYIWGLVPPYRGNVLASRPTTFDSVKELAQRLIDHEAPSTPSMITMIATAPIKTSDNKRKRWDRKKGKSTQSSSKNQQVVAFHAATTPAALVPTKTYAGNLPNFDSHPILKPHGEGIVEKCDGLPLALIALGRLLRTKRDEEEWKELLNSEIWRLGKRDEIIPALRLSYNDLSASLKQLFGYCSLFPKDYVFNKEKLILLWMAEGFLHNENTNKSMERLGLEYFDDLLSRSFFQHALDDKSLFVMHDLMNDLATSVAGDYFLRLDIEMKKEALEKYRHISFVCERFMVYKRFEPFKGAKKLRTFLAMPVGMIESWTTFYLSNKVLDDLLHELPLLRVLSLSHLSIKEVPEIIGSLKHLRYLNLSHTTITHLPENICNLYNLQTLILCGCCFITKFPDNFLKLRNLRHLDISDTPGLKKMSSGIGELKNLHTLSKVIIGGENRLNELKNLQNLHGKISVWGLGDVQNAMEAREANLSQKKLSELQLDWGYGDYGLNVSRKQTHDKEVLNELKPDNDSLKKLEILSYGGTEFPNWVGNPSFLILTHVSINFCEECTCLPSLGKLPSLKELFILGMSKVKVIDLELLGTGVAFPSLEILSFRHMSGWEVWSTDNGGVVDTAFPCLQELHIEFCPNLVQVSLEALPSLRVLEIKGCGHGVLTTLLHVASSVTMLEIDNISGLTDELWRSVFKYLGKLEKLYISGCNEIRYLWQSEVEASKSLVNLRNLNVSACSNLVGLGEKVEDNCGSIQTFIRMLSIARCESIEHCSCPNSIEFLNIHDCDSITSVSFPTGGGKKLKSFAIEGCQKFLEEDLGGEKSRLLIKSSMQMLESVDINGWVNLKSIIELSYCIHLTTLMITKCPKMESFPDHELPNLTSLTILVIAKCPSIDASFPRGLWPPKLSYLGIGGLKKPISEWGPQNFPTSLENLMLNGGIYDDVKNFDQLSHLFPSSLASLSIMGFQKLESVSMGLQNLTFLQRLFVSKCPKMLHLPEKLFPSLLSLRIDGCPNLNERSIRRSSYWPLISLIPDSTFDE
ncbi:putative disease resistance protein At3g14460 [Lactuca sativa]|uniref:putative disease resistance protein At3g14460 n=1 Tax=Lactuca sativa TaxID=4236 RepID=UPI0022AF67D0|nr:putative disease resistance protein At3g14460 [Lactuca sativa]